jgi:putative acetyltransferase
VIVRPESPLDVAAIWQINVAAFKDHPFSRQTEHLIVDALREAGALELSLVAEGEGRVVGHIAFSPCRIGEVSRGWLLLGPVAVEPDHQGRGIGSTLIEAGLEALRARAALGCVLVGDPAFYRRFGFRHHPGLVCPGVPDEYVLCLPLQGDAPTGEVEHHSAFSAEGP